MTRGRIVPAMRSSRGGPLRIGLLAPPWVPVPPPLYGGTERVIDLLARGLVEAGHEVVLFTTGDATCPVPRRWHVPTALGVGDDQMLELEHVTAAYESLVDVDLVHDHTVMGPSWAGVLSPGLPVVTTNHGPFNPSMLAHFGSFAERVPVIAISNHQRRTASTVPIAAVIHHGLDLRAVPVGDGLGGHLVFLGRMSPDKGAHRAIHAARAAGKHLVLAARMRGPEELAYFEREVAPLLGDDATYVGELAGPAKHALLGSAEALLNPIRWPEPFGLVMVESLACGTPVVTFPEGAAPEIVEHGRTGFLCRDDHDLVRRLGEVGRLDRDTCRASASERFSLDRFVAEHVALYRRVLDARRSVVPRMAVTVGAGWRTRRDPSPQPLDP